MSREDFSREILNNLSYVPCWYGNKGVPGIMKTKGAIAQPVFTGSQPSQVFLAAAEYGNGRVFICTQDCYVSWLGNTDETDSEEFNEVRRLFLDNVKSWLIKSKNLNNLKIIDINDVNENKSIDLKTYKIVKWQQSVAVSEKKQQLLLKYLDAGGSLFIAITPWACKNLENVDAYNFLKTYFDVILTKDYIQVKSMIPIVENQVVTMNSSEDTLVNLWSDFKNNAPKLETLLDSVAANDPFCDKVLQCIQNVLPQSRYPVGNIFAKGDDSLLLQLWGKCLTVQERYKAPFIDDFPGDFYSLPDLVSEVRLNIETDFAEWVSTGYYLPAGVTMEITVEDGDTSVWKLRVGAHKDDVSGCKEGINRWPKLSITKPLEQSMTFCSPFGGNIYFESTDAGNISVVLSNVIETPYYNIYDQDSIDNWDNSRQNSPGLWAEIAGEHFIFTVPSSCVRDLEDPSEIITFWDQVLENHHKLRGSDINAQRRERVVADKQTALGYMHSGYPIMVHLDVCGIKSQFSNSFENSILNINQMKTRGSWGLFHEFGHNMQRSQWTFDGSVEVTVNIFSMHAMEKMLGYNVWQQEWLTNQRNDWSKFFLNSPNYEKWTNGQNPGMTLMTFALLIKNFGWEPMYKFMSAYESDLNNGYNLPKNNQEKIDQWVIRYSKILQKNIKPHFELCGLPVSSKVDQILSTLAKWIPKDVSNPDKFYS